MHALEVDANAVAVGFRDEDEGGVVTCDPPLGLEIVRGAERTPQARVIEIPEGPAELHVGRLAVDVTIAGTPAVIANQPRATTIPTTTAGNAERQDASEHRHHPCSFHRNSPCFTS